MQKNIGKAVAIISGIFSGLFLNMILSGGIADTNIALGVLQLLKATLLVIAVVGTVAWVTHMVLRPKKQKT